MRTTVLALKPVLAALMLGAAARIRCSPENAWKIAPVQKVRHGGSNAAGHFALGRYPRRPGRIRTGDHRVPESARRGSEICAGVERGRHAAGAAWPIDDGLAALERAVQLQPSASHLHNNLGYALLLAGRAEPAVGSLRRAVELDAGNQRAWRNLAEASRQTGAVEEAAFADARAEGRATTAGYDAGRPFGGERRDALAGAQAASAPAVSAARPGQSVTSAASVRPEAVMSPSAPVVQEAAMSPTSDSRQGTKTPRLFAASAPASGETSRVEIVKIAENVFELRNGPATRADTAAAAAAIVTSTTRPTSTSTSTSTAATVTPIRSSRPETIAAAPAPVAARTTPTSGDAEPASSAARASWNAPASSAVPPSSAVRASSVAPASSAAPASSGAPASSAAPASAAASSPTARSSRPARYEIANGHGGEGLARRLAGLLAAEGFARPRLTNHVPYNQPASYVAYRDGYRDEAEAFAARLPFRPQVLPSPSKGLAVDVRLLLGRDLTTSSACAVLALCPAVATKPSAPRFIRVDAV